MSVDVVVLVVSTAAALAAVVVLTARDGGPRPDRRASFAGGAGPVAPAAAAGLLVLGFTGWVVPSLVVAVAAGAAARRWQHRNRRRTDDVTRTEALASWIEHLRDVLIAGDQPIGAITATVSTCPAAIRPEVRRLAAGLGRQPADVVLRRFADEVDDPLGDLVAAGLLIAIERGARTVAVLTSLAEQARLQADRRRLVEAERAPVQREVVMLTVIMGSLVAALFVFARAEYLAPYDTPTGQLFLGAVLAIYLVLLARVQRLAHYPRPGRFLVTGPADAGRGAAQQTPMWGSDADDPTVRTRS